MVLAFQNSVIRGICEDEGCAIKLYGEHFSSFLFSRIADLEAARNVNELIVGRPSEIIYNGENCYKVDVLDGKKIIFCNNHTKNKKPSGWNNVSRIRILNIE